MKYLMLFYDYMLSPVITPRHTNLMLERFTFLKNVCKDSSVKFPSLNTECYGWIVKERIIMEY